MKSLIQFRRHLWSLLAPPVSLRKYRILTAVLTVSAPISLLLSNIKGNHYAWSLLGLDDEAPICNMSVIARVIFVVLATIDILAIVGVLTIAAIPAATKPERVQRVKISRKIVIDRAQKCLLAVTFIILGHLGLYATAFRPADVCRNAWPPSLFRVNDYIALGGFTLMYSASTILMVACLIFLLRHKLPI